MKKFVSYLLTIILLAAVAGALCSSTSADALGPGHIAITVVDQAGKPVAGATVWVTPFAPGSKRITITTDAMGAASAALSPWPQNAACGRATVYAHGFGLNGAVLKQTATTIILRPEAPILGIVDDPDGKPVSGARVRLEYVQSGGPDGFVMPPADDPDFTATSKADGSFGLAGGFASCVATVKIDDPRYVSLTARSAGDSALTLTARPGASIAGRVVYPDGKPANDVEVFAERMAPDDWWIPVKTDEDGRYRLYGLAAGVVSVETDPGQQLSDWVSVALQNVAVTEGQTAQDPDIVLVHGATIGGVVTDPAGKPIAGVSIGCYGPHRPIGQAACTSATTDASGHYQLRAPAGTSLVYVMGAPEGYLRPNDQKHITVVDGAAEVQAFQLQEGSRIAGKIVDEQGAVLSGIDLSIDSHDGQVRATCASGGDGTFHAAGLPAGKLSMTVGDTWTIVSGGEINTTQSGEVKIVLRKAVLVSVSGTVRSPSGQPLSDVLVTAEVMPIASGMSEQRTAQSDASGRYTLSNLPTGRTVSLTFAKGKSRLKSGGQVSTTSPGYAVSDAILAALDGTVTGRVVDNLGRPVRSAEVASPDSGEPVTTSPDGTFTIGNLMQGPVRIMAAKGGDYGEADADTGSSVSITLASPRSGAKPRDADLAIRILDDAVAGSEQGHFYARSSLADPLVESDPDAAYELARTIEQTGSGGACCSVISRVLEQDKPENSDWILHKLSGLKEGYAKRWLLLELALRLHASDSAAALRYYQQAMAEIGDPSELGWQELAALIAYGATIGDSTMEKYYDLALAKAKAEPHQDGYEDSVEGFVDMVGAGSPALASRAILELPADKRTDELAQIARDMAQVDPMDAEKILANCGASSFSCGVATVAIVDRIAATDPDHAMTLANSIADPAHKGVALATVAQYRPVSERMGLYRQAFGLVAGDEQAYVLAPWIASLAYVADPGVGKQLFDQARVIASAPPDGPYDEKNDLAFAFYSAALEPGESRLRIERDFAKQKTDGRQPWLLVRCVLAMAAVDPVRAGDMAKEITGDAKFDAMRKIAQYLLATDTVRRTLRFDRWCASDSWTPGTPTEW